MFHAHLTQANNLLNKKPENERVNESNGTELHEFLLAYPDLATLWFI
jgi:hypothetical protein